MTHTEEYLLRTQQQILQSCWINMYVITDFNISIEWYHIVWGPPPLYFIIWKINFTHKYNHYFQYSCMTQFKICQWPKNADHHTEHSIKRYSTTITISFITESICKVSVKFHSQGGLILKGLFGSTKGGIIMPF